MHQTYTCAYTYMKTKLMHINFFKELKCIISVKKELLKCVQAPGCWAEQERSLTNNCIKKKNLHAVVGSTLLAYTFHITIIFQRAIWSLSCLSPGKILRDSTSVWKMRRVLQAIQQSLGRPALLQRTLTLSNTKKASLEMPSDSSCLVPCNQ